MGWGVVDSEAGRLRHVAHGVIRSGTGTMPDRLARLFEGLNAVLEEWNPDGAAVEETFVNSNSTSSLKLGQARAICLLSPALKGIELAEYAPNKIKKSVVGQGHASKDQIAHMVAMLLPGTRPESMDACDALALAICHAHHSGSAAARIKVAS